MYLARSGIARRVTLILSELLLLHPLNLEELGAPDKIRTCDLLLRRQALYPSELRARFVLLRRFAD